MIFITGATGFLGAYITHYLVEKGEKVRALRRTSSPMGLCKSYADKVDWIEGDLNDLHVLKRGMDGVEKVYHIAGLVSFDPKDKEALYKINYKGTQKLINTALDCGVRKILYSSSIAAVGRSEMSNLVSEDTEWQDDSKWNSDYGNSKRLGEMELWRGAAEGLEAVAVNPTIILGSGYWKGSLAFLKTVERGLKFYPGGKTGFVDVRDVAQICIRLMDSDINNERYIINAKDIYFRDFFDNIAHHLNVVAPHKRAGFRATEFVWRLEWLRSRLTGKRPIITKNTARVSQKEWNFSNEKISKELDYSFRDIDKTIQEMCEDYVKSKREGKRFGFRI